MNKHEQNKNNQAIYSPEEGKSLRWEGFVEQVVFESRVKSDGAMGDQSGKSTDENCEEHRKR